VELLNAEGGKRGLPQRPVCVFQLPSIATVGFLGPRMRLSLPSFRCDPSSFVSFKGADCHRFVASELCSGPNTAGAAFWL
jgi:hypothetical protein